MSQIERDFKACLDRALNVLNEAKFPVSATFRIYLDDGCVPQMEYEIKESVLGEKAQQ